MVPGQVNLTLIVPLDEPIPPPEQIDKRWLTAVLKKNGALIAGEIRRLEVDYSNSTNSHITRIRIEYDPETRGDAHRSLILKTVDAEAGFIQRSEVDYYTRDYLGLTDAPIPKCCAAHVSDGGSYSILMEDLSSTHEKDTSPSLEYGQAVAAALARLHAFGWGEERIRQLGGCIPNNSKIGQYVDDLSYLMVQYWDTKLRQDLETSILRVYHRQLIPNGVASYDWDQLIADYKLCAVQAVYTVAEWCIKAEDRERMRWLWRLELDRAMHAFFDLSCGELWPSR